jgi:bacteriocin-like protein
MSKNLDDKDLENISGGGDGQVFEGPTGGTGGGGGESPGGTAISPEEPVGGGLPPSGTEQPGGIGEEEDPGTFNQ